MQLFEIINISQFSRDNPRNWRPHVLAVMALLLSGCLVQAVKQENLKDPALTRIHQAFVTTVNRAQSDSQRAWQNGRLGNMVVNIIGGENVGLCYQWQELVYVGIQPALRQTGWQARGISINKGTFFEHHAVVVYNPNISSPDTLLQKPDQQGVYVLDPWESGKANIYTLSDWLKKPWVIEVPAKITNLRQFTITGYKP